MLNATSNIKLQLRQLDGPTRGQGTLLLQGTKLQQALMQDWEMQSNRLDCWVRQKETKRMSDKKGKKKEWEKDTQKTNTFNIHDVYASEHKGNQSLKATSQCILDTGKTAILEDRTSSQAASPTVVWKQWERRTLVTVLRCKIQINQFNLEQTQLGSVLQWSLACAPLM